MNTTTNNNYPKWTILPSGFITTEQDGILLIF